ncbi:hypothetical protein OHB24_40180 [Kribbella sp. NBC_00482]|uniref:hypothetical protein n=1 Tax=Kribbella sp. NBC_00482 TaxID=2975968 RepID=UPI002E18E51F
MTATALVGLGLGAVLRSTAAAVVALFVLPGLTSFLPAPWGDRVRALVLPNLAEQVAGTGTGSVLEPVLAACVVAAYVLLAVGGGAIALLRRDV